MGFVERVTGAARERARRLVLTGHPKITTLYAQVRRRAGRVEPGALSIIRPLDVELLVRTGLEQVRAGRLRDAVATFERACALSPRNERAVRFGRQAAGDLRVLGGDWRAPAVRGPNGTTPVRGRVLHVVGKSLPFQNGYTLRTQSIVHHQSTVDLEPVVTTDDAFERALADVAPDVVAATPIERTPDGVEVIGSIAHHRIPALGTRSPGLDERLDHRIRCGARVVEAVEPAVLHASSDFLNAEAALAWGRAHGLPVVYEVRGFWAETWLSKGRGDGADRSDVYLGRRTRERDCMAGADAVVTLGSAMRDEIVAQGIDPDKVTVIPNAVDLERFVPGERDPVLAAALGVRDRDLVVGLVTSVTPYEGIHLLLDAIATLRAAGRPVRGLVVGEGTERPDLERRCKELGIRERVTFTGWVPTTRVVEYYRLFDVFVVPRVSQRVCELVTPIKPYEAMAMSLPLVVSDVGALREMVVEGETALVFRAGDAGDLADAIDSLLSDADVRRTLGAGARAWVGEHRSWPHNAQRYRQLYRTLGVVD
jgi:glycosyltransferase involved in cell wall biosynthesis